MTQFKQPAVAIKYYYCFQWKLWWRSSNTSSNSLVMVIGGFPWLVQYSIIATNRSLQRRSMLRWSPYSFIKWLLAEAGADDGECTGVSGAYYMTMIPSPSRKQTIGIVDIKQTQDVVKWYLHFLFMEPKITIFLSVKLFQASKYPDNFPGTVENQQFLSFSLHPIEAEKT